jgi:diamine N-acetyltransferase
VTPTQTAQKPFIRHATLRDTELLTELGARTFAETFAVDNTEANMKAYLADAFNHETQAAELSDVDSLILIAEVDGEAAGYAMISSGHTAEGVTGEKPIEIVRLYVSKDSLGSGVGAALMQACIDEAADKGFDTIWLGVWENNFRAQAFYRKWNFTEVGTHIFMLGDDRQTDLVMARSI